MEVENYPKMEGNHYWNLLEGPIFSLKHAYGRKGTHPSCDATGSLQVAMARSEESTLRQEEQARVDEPERRSCEGTAASNCI